MRAEVEVLQRKGAEGRWQAKKRELTMETQQSGWWLDEHDIMLFHKTWTFHFKYFWQGYDSDFPGVFLLGYPSLYLY